MPQQHRLETGALPHDADVVFNRYSPHEIGTLCIARYLIVKQHEARRWCSAHPPQSVDSTHRHFNTRERITSARHQYVNFKINR